MVKGRSPRKIDILASAIQFENLSRSLCAPAILGLLSLTPSTAVSQTFNYSSVVSGPTQTLSAFVQDITQGGTITVNGADTAQPTAPFIFAWGDGSSTAGFFNIQHSYSATDRNYIIVIKATENDGSTQQTTIPVFFVPPALAEISLPGVTFEIPAQPVSLGTHYYYAAPSDETFFADGDLAPPYSRDTMSYILAAVASIDKDFANDNVYLLDGTLEITMLKNVSYSGGYSFWYTTPMAVGFGQFVVSPPIQWYILFNEIGKDMVLNSPVSFPFGGNTDGGAAEIFVETMGDIFSYAAGCELVNNATTYGIEKDAAVDIGNSMLAGATGLKVAYDAYVSAGSHFDSWNPFNGGADPTIGTLTALSWKFIEHAELQNHGYQAPAKRLMRFLQMFDPSLLALYDPHDDTQAGAIFRATLMVTALSYAFSQDLRDEFRGLNFPIDDRIYRELYLERVRLDACSESFPGAPKTRCPSTWWPVP